MSDTISYNEHLQILQAKEIKELYAIPAFDLEDRMTYLSLSVEEYALMQTFRGLSLRVFFILQLGYFKAKHLFYIFDFGEQCVDVDFILHKYFSQNKHQELKPISKPTRLGQRQVICQFLGYQFFEASLLDITLIQAAVFAKR